MQKRILEKNINNITMPPNSLSFFFFKVIIRLLIKKREKGYAPLLYK